MEFRSVLQNEFDRRRGMNSRYTLRRFAQALRVHHATLSRVLRGRRPLRTAMICSLGKRLGCTDAEITRFILREDCAAVLAAIAHPRSYPNSRRLAVIAGISLDRVNIAVHALLRDGRLHMRSPDQWTVTEGFPS